MEVINEENISYRGSWFIGSKVSEMLFEDGYDVIGVDNLNDYYDTRLKLWPLNNLKNSNSFNLFQVDIENYDDLKLIF